jgi:hypothetical protein
VYIKGLTMAGITKFLSKAMEPAWKWAATRYQAAVGRELKKYGKK